MDRRLKSGDMRTYLTVPIDCDWIDAFESISTGRIYTKWGNIRQLQCDHLLPVLFSIIFNIVHVEELYNFLEGPLNSSKGERIPKIRLEKTSNRDPNEYLRDSKSRKHVNIASQTARSSKSNNASLNRMRITNVSKPSSGQFGAAKTTQIEDILSRFQEQEEDFYDHDQVHKNIGYYVYLDSDFIYNENFETEIKIGKKINQSLQHNHPHVSVEDFLLKRFKPLIDFFNKLVGKGKKNIPDILSYDEYIELQTKKNIPDHLWVRVESRSQPGQIYWGRKDGKITQFERPTGLTIDNWEPDTSEEKISKKQSRKKQLKNIDEKVNQMFVKSESGTRHTFEERYVKYIDYLITIYDKILENNHTEQFETDNEKLDQVKDIASKRFKLIKEFFKSNKSEIDNKLNRLKKNIPEIKKLINISGPPSRTIPKFEYIIYQNELNEHLVNKDYRCKLTFIEKRQEKKDYYQKFIDIWNLTLKENYLDFQFDNNNWMENPNNNAKMNYLGISHSEFYKSRNNNLFVYRDKKYEDFFNNKINWLIDVINAGDKRLELEMARHDSKQPYLPPWSKKQIEERKRKLERNKRLLKEVKGKFIALQKRELYIPIKLKSFGKDVNDRFGYIVEYNYIPLNKKIEEIDVEFEEYENEESDEYINFLNNYPYSDSPSPPNISEIGNFIQFDNKIPSYPTESGTNHFKDWRYRPTINKICTNEQKQICDKLKQMRETIPGIVENDFPAVYGKDYGTATYGTFSFNAQWGSSKKFPKWLKDVAISQIKFKKYLEKDIKTLEEKTSTDKTQDDFRKDIAMKRTEYDIDKIDDDLIRKLEEVINEIEIKKRSKKRETGVEYIAPIDDDTDNNDKNDDDDNNDDDDDDNDDNNNNDDDDNDDDDNNNDEVENIHPPDDDNNNDNDNNNDDDNNNDEVENIHPPDDDNNNENMDASDKEFEKDLKKLYEDAEYTGIPPLIYAAGISEGVKYIESLLEKGERFDDKTRAGLNVLHICTGANGELKFLVTFLKIIGFEKGRELVKQGDNKEVTPLERANKEKGNASHDTIKKLYIALDENNKSKYDELIDDAEQEIEHSNMKKPRISTPVQTQTIGDWRTDENGQYNDSLSVDEKNRFLDKHADLQQFAYRLPETRDNPMGDDDVPMDEPALAQPPPMTEEGEIPARTREDDPLDLDRYLNATKDTPIDDDDVAMTELPNSDSDIHSPAAPPVFPSEDESDDMAVDRAELLRPAPYWPSDDEEDPDARLTVGDQLEDSSTSSTTPEQRRALFRVTRPRKRSRSSSGGKKYTRRRVKKSSKKKLGYKLRNTRKQK